MRKKLFLSTIGIILLTLILSIVSVDIVFRRQFTDYISQSNETMLEQLPSRLGAIYLKNGSWDTSSLEQINNSLPMEAYVTLKDPHGNIIARLENPMNAMHTHTGMPSMSSMDYTVQAWKTQSLPITGPRGIIAVAEIRYPTRARILDPQDEYFSAAVYNSLIVAGTISLIIGVVLSFLMSRRLVSPLRSLTAAAYRIGAGNLDERVSSRTADEVGWLAKAFNAMADNLKGQERLRKQFTADIAHELRTPLTSIRSYIEAFQDGVLPANAENLASISEEIDRLVGLVSDLSDLNIAEMGALAISPHPINLGSVIEKVIRNLTPAIQDKGLTISFANHTTNAEISGDEHLLTRLYYNLIHNSYKFTESGGAISVTLDSFIGQVQVKIKDSGIGMPKSVIPLIFERFYREDQSRNRETGGSGIGLALVKQIVLLHQGTISVESELGDGSVFTVTLPKSV